MSDVIHARKPEADNSVWAAIMAGEDQEEREVSARTF
jgi:hypothetical protein